MARNESSKGMADGLFGAKVSKPVVKVTTEQQNETAVVKAEPVPAPAEKNERKAVQREQITINKGGRPRDSDLKDGEEVRKTSLQLTDEVLYKLDAFLLTQKGKTRSQIVRELVRKHL